MPTVGSPEANATAWEWLTAMYASSGEVMEYQRGVGLFYLVDHVSLRATDLQRALEEAHKHVAVALM